MGYFKESILFFIFFLVISINAQQDILREIRYKFETFQYEDVIRLSDQVIVTYRDLPPDTLLNVYTMKAVAHYTLNQEESARRSFIEILKINKDYALDPVTISPKIITFFESIRTDYNRILETRNIENNLNKDSIKTEVQKINIENFNRFQSSIVKSILVPGLGHLSNKNDLKGWVLTSLSTINIGALIYFVFDTNKKEDGYLNESNPNFINDRYNQYNSSFKARNALIISYLILWAYTQIDLLFFEDFNRNDVNLPQLNADILPDNSVRLSLSFKLVF